MLNSYAPIAQSIADILYPFAEVVIHNLKTQKIEIIFNAFSLRKKGDESLLDMDDPEIYENLQSQNASTYGPYIKHNWNGRTIKSTSSVLKDKNGNLVGLLCINMDVTPLLNISKSLEQFTTDTTLQKPQILFKNDWQDRVHTHVHIYLKEHNVAFDALSRAHKKELVKDLFKSGAFDGKHAADYIADVLKLSRATIYNYLNNK